MSNNKIENLIPIDFSRNITPFVIGDVINHAVAGRFTLETEDQVNNFNNGNLLDNDYSIVSFADRPNTGKQPVGDDVVVDFICDNGEGQYLAASKIEWKIGDSHGFSPRSWKPNHAAMLKQYQAEQAPQKLDEGDVITVNCRDELPDAVIDKAEEKAALVDENSDSCKIGNIGNILHNISCSKVDDEDQAEFGRYASYCWELSRQLNQSTVGALETPAFTQEMFEAEELPPVGCVALLTCDGIFDKGLKEGDEVLIGGHADFGSGSVAVFCKEAGNNTGTGISSMFKPIDTRTDEEKAIDDLKKATGLRPGQGSLIVAEEVFKAIESGKITGIKWVGE